MYKAKIRNIASFPVNAPNGQNGVKESLCSQATFKETYMFNLRPKCLQITTLLDRHQANLCFHFAGSGENCRILQSQVMLAWTIRNLALSPDSDEEGTTSCFKPQVAIFQLRFSYKSHKSF